MRLIIFIADLLVIGFIVSAGYSLYLKGRESISKKKEVKKNVKH